MRFLALSAFALFSTAALAEAPQDTIIRILNGLEPGETKVFHKEKAIVTLSSQASPAGVVEMIMSTPNGEGRIRSTYVPAGDCKFKLSAAVAKPGMEYKEEFTAVLDLSAARNVAMIPSAIAGLSQTSVEGLDFQCVPSPGGSCAIGNPVTFFSVGQQAGRSRALADFVSNACRT